MMTMADSPKTSSYYPLGKWMSRETLISSLNMSTKQLVALWVKLQVLHVKAVQRDRVSFHGSPFESPATFYYVTQVQSNVCLG
jgi:hypothetical protein